MERSIYNVQFCHAEIEEVYLELFDEALERYNAKQKRNDRKIDNYYEKIRRGKQDKLFHKAVFQIGNRDDMNAKSEEGGLAKEVLIEYMKNFQKRNPYLHAFSAHLHMDEETPHVHVDFVPAVCNSKRGLDTRVSLEGALGEQGFKSGTRGATEWNQWIESEKRELAQIMGRYGIEWKQLGTHNKHLSVLDFDDYIYVLKSFVDYMIEQYEGNREQKTINVGQNIRHKRLGEGVITKTTGEELFDLVTVKFADCEKTVLRNIIDKGGYEENLTNVKRKLSSNRNQEIINLIYEKLQ